MEFAIIAIKLCVLLILVCGVWSNRSSQNVRVIKNKFRAETMLRKFFFLNFVKHFFIAFLVLNLVSTFFFKQ